MMANESHTSSSAAQTLDGQDSSAKPARMDRHLAQDVTYDDWRTNVIVASRKAKKGLEFKA